MKGRPIDNERATPCDAGVVGGGRVRTTENGFAPSLPFSNAKKKRKKRTAAESSTETVDQPIETAGKIPKKNKINKENEKTAPFLHICLGKHAVGSVVEKLGHFAPFKHVLHGKQEQDPHGGGPSPFRSKLNEKKTNGPSPSRSNADEMLQISSGAAVELEVERRFRSSGTMLGQRWAEHSSRAHSKWPVMDRRLAGDQSGAALIKSLFSWRNRIVGEKRKSRRRPDWLRPGDQSGRSIVSSQPLIGRHVAQSKTPARPGRYGRRHSTLIGWPVLIDSS